MAKDCNCSCDKTQDPRYIELEQYIKANKDTLGNTVPILQEAQRIFGYLPLEVQKFISDHTGTAIAEIYGVSTFYSQFHIAKKGRHRIDVCLGTACYVKGAQKLIEKVAEELDIKIGGTTKDGSFSLDAARCLGCCGLAPVMMIDGDVYARLDSAENVSAIIEKYRD